MHPADNHYRNQTVRIADLTVISDLIQGVTFENCHVVGPAVFAMDRCEFNNCSFMGDVANMLYPVDRNWFIGVVGLIECRFFGCRLERVGFTGPQESLANLLRSIEQH